MASQSLGIKNFPIIDSHIHLYASTHLPFLNWTGSLPADHPLKRQNSVDQYKSASSGQDNLLGFVFLETDRKSGLQVEDWKNVLEEVDYLARIANGNPKNGEGHSVEDKRLLLGFVPWAPMPAGSEILSKYVDQVLEHSGNSANNPAHVKGFRYLLQNKPRGTMIQPQFLESLVWLAEHNFSFDLGIDTRTGGLGQLREACEMMEMLAESKHQPTIIINHFCKPNLRNLHVVQNGMGPGLEHWKGGIERLASYKSTYMKLSGFFSELHPQTEIQPFDVDEIVRRTKPWVDVVFAAFGAKRIMFGSDWPVCNVGGPGIELSWQHWYNAVRAMLDAQNLSDDEKFAVWSGTAAEAYKINRQ